MVEGVERAFTELASAGIFSPFGVAIGNCQTADESRQRNGIIELELGWRCVFAIAKTQ